MNNWEDILSKEIELQGLPDLSEKQKEAFRVYFKELTEWNGKMNLTAITDPEEIAIKHFADSLLLLKTIQPDRGAALMDVGTGAGFPAVPVGILREDLGISLVDSQKKRLLFLEDLCGKLPVFAVCIHGRAEELAHGGLRESQDLVTARAVARLRILAEYCLPFVKPGGCFAAMKGPEAEEELTEAFNAIRILGGKVERTDWFSLSDGSVRSIVLIRKEQNTPERYPRRTAKITREPL